MLMASGKTSLNCPDKRTKIGRQAEAHLPHAVCQEIPALSPRKTVSCDTSIRKGMEIAKEEQPKNRLCVIFRAGKCGIIEGKLPYQHLQLFKKRVYVPQHVITRSSWLRSRKR
jgi:hypothetical protein